MAKGTERKTINILSVTNKEISKQCKFPNLFIKINAFISNREQNFIVKVFPC